jgi:hypothetical protein
VSHSPQEKSPPFQKGGENKAPFRKGGGDYGKPHSSPFSKRKEKSKTKKVSTKTGKGRTKKKTGKIFVFS